MELATLVRPFDLIALYIVAMLFALVWLRCVQPVLAGLSRPSRRETHLRLWCPRARAIRPVTALVPANDLAGASDLYLEHQLERLYEIVTRQTVGAYAVATMQARATDQIDAAEYALDSLLAELAVVMPNEIGALKADAVTAFPKTNQPRSLDTTLLAA
jgi:hypothetical protein